MAKLPGTAITDGTITATQLAAANVDGAANVASMRTLGTGEQQAAAGNHSHANHAHASTAITADSSGLTNITGSTVAAQMTSIDGQLGGSWVTGLNLDLTAEASQTLNSNTTYTIGGKTWTRENAVAADMRTILSTGLRITPVSGAGDYWQNTRTSGILRVPLSSLITNWHQSMPIRLWVHISAFNCSTATHQLRAFFESGQTMNASNRVFSVYGGQSPAQLALVNQNAAADVSDSGYSAAGNVIVIECPAGIAAGVARSFNGSWSAGWPTSLTYNATSDQKPYTGTVTKDGPNFGLVCQHTSGTALVVDIAHVRIDYKA